MCEPMTMGLIMAGVSAASASAQVRGQNKMAEAESQAAKDSANADYAAMLEQQYQIRDKSALDIVERTRQGLRERAKISVQQAEGGVVGNTAIREFTDSIFQESYDTQIIKSNEQGALNQNRREISKINSIQQSRINSAQSRVINPFMAGLQIAGSAMSGFSSGYSFGQNFTG